MKITMIVEGKTEKAFLPYLKEYLENRLSGKKLNIDIMPYDGRIPKEDKLKKVVANLLYTGSDYVIALTDVYTGTHDFTDAADAKRKMREWVGDEPRFHPHAAQHDFEAWLLSYWDDIKRIAGHNKGCPSGNPENVNHNKPPSHHLKEIFNIGSCRDDYNKPRDAKRILKGKDLSVAVSKCPELKSLINTFLSISGGQTIP